MVSQLAGVFIVILFLVGAWKAVAYLVKKAKT
jgi:hypothetical protein